MATLYSAFLVRCWWLGDGAQRYEVQHIHSGERTVVTSAGAAAEWIRERSGGPASPRPPRAWAEAIADDEGTGGPDD